MAYASQMKRHPASGINIMVAGGGIAGLSFAIEAHRKGHRARVLERRPKFEDFGEYLPPFFLATAGTLRYFPGG
jgi:2-polyprenyl-6-methoxyphenol hydroxylase-like FAD-dependent oxidoreductase